jgi:hypothetical protein
MKPERTKGGRLLPSPIRSLFPSLGEEALLCNEARSVSLPPAAWRAIDGTAASADVSRSAFIGFAVAYFLEIAAEERALMLPL